MARTPEAEAAFARLFGEQRIAALQRKEPAFEKDFNDFMINNVGTGPWSRGVLSPQKVSIATLSLLAASGRFRQFESHFRIALRTTQVPVEELRELLLHLTMYCGMPVGTEIFGIARKVMAELGVDPDSIGERGGTPG